MERSASSPKQFGLVMAAAFSVLFLVHFVWKGTSTWWLLGLAIAFLFAALIIPSWLVPIEKGWMRFAAVLGSINSRILLTVVFIVIVVPITMVLRILGKSPIETSWKSSRSSYWHSRNPEEFSASRLERQF
jgi:ABC-type sulfate transport system permease subunit